MNLLSVGPLAAVQVVLGALVVGSWVFCLLTVVAAYRYRRIVAPNLGELPPVTVMKPLCGAEPGLREYLTSCFEQDYPEFEILFAVHHEDDPAVPIVNELRARFADVPSQLVVTGEPPQLNRKVYSLQKMLERARHEFLVMADSDVEWPPGALRRVAGELSMPGVGVVTCPYRAVPEPGFWSGLEGLGVNTEFMGGVLVAKMVSGMDFAIGPTLAVRRETIRKLGGFEPYRDYLAEDFLLGRHASEAGYAVLLSSQVVDHHIGGGGFRVTLRHRLRWMRSSRRSRPAGYLGQLFTYPVPLALFALLLPLGGWALLGSLVLRITAGLAVGRGVLHDTLTASRWWLMPFQDLLSFATWIAAFTGSTIQWRGRNYRLGKGGRLEAMQRRSKAFMDPL